MKQDPKPVSPEEAAKILRPANEGAYRRYFEQKEKAGKGS